MDTLSLPSINSQVELTAHRQSGGLWYAVKHPSHQQFFRMGSREYRIASMLNGTRTAEQVVEHVNATHPEIRCTTDEVLQVATWLAKTGLEAPSPNSTASSDYALPSRANTPASWMLSINPLFAKITLVPGATMERIGRALLPACHLNSLVAVALLGLVALVCVLLNWHQFTSVAGKLFVPDGQLWWLAAWLLLKAAHELGHVLFAVRVGCKIRSAGISLICLAPVPFVDISDLWSISNRWQRILCCAGGMIAEISLAAIAAIVAVTSDNPTLQYLGCAVATMGTITTLAFNANPLIRFDGYYILSDALEYPNLYSDAQQAAKRFLLKCLQPWMSMPQRLNLGLSAYGLASMGYRVIMLITLAVWLLLVWQGIGLVLVAWGVYGVVISPLLRSLKAPPTSAGRIPATGTHRHRVWAQRAGMAATALLIGSLFTWLPSPIQPSAAGYVNYRDPVVVRAETEGFLVASQLLQKDSTPGDKRVRAGDVLAVLINPELELELALKANEVATVQETIRLQRAQGNLAQLQSNQAKLVSLQQQLRQLQERLEKLEIRAPVDGNVATNDLRRLNGTFLHAGDPICTLADPQRLEVVAFIGQNDIEHLRSSQGQSVPIVLAGGPTILGIVDRVDPRARKVLPAPVLAACYGGPIAVTLGESAAGEELLEMLDPRFQVHIRVPEKSFGDLQPGQTTSVRIPQRTASLWALLDHWCRRKWNALWSDSRQQGI